MGLLNKKKDTHNKKVILHVGRKDKIVPYLTTARRVKYDDKGLHYKLKDPLNPKIEYDIMDIPTRYFSSTGVIELYTPDFEQFVPSKSSIKITHMNKIQKVKKSIDDTVDLNLHLLSSDQKVWYEKSVKEDILRTVTKSWWTQNHMMIMTIIVLAALILLAYIIGNTLSAVAIDLTGAVGQLSGKIDTLIPPPV